MKSKREKHSAQSKDEAIERYLQRRKLIQSLRPIQYFDPEDLERAKSLSREQICQFIEDFRDLYGPIFQKRIEGLEIGD
ncbi:hypothetical protein HOF92_14055 [bacterium]|jgi:hypothetical protein|nr:hypothetical protein [bacterium]